MLNPVRPLFDRENHHRSPITKDAAEAFTDEDNIPTPVVSPKRRADSTPRARRKKDHRDNDQTKERISRLSEDEQHIMKDYAGNTRENRMETLAKLEEYRDMYGSSPIKSAGQLGPKKGKTKVEWSCGMCAERKNTFQKIAGHITSHHWKLKVWTCLDEHCGRKYCSLNELTRHTKETHRKTCIERSNDQTMPAQSTLRPSEEPDSMRPATHGSGSNYSDGMPVSRSSRSSHLMISNGPTSLPPAYPYGSTQEQGPTRRYPTRSTRTAPYPVASKYSRIPHASTASRTPSGTRHEQGRPAYRNYSSTAEQREGPVSSDGNNYQDISKTRYHLASNDNASPSLTLQPNPTTNRSPNSTGGAAPTHVAAGPYSEEGRVSIHSTIPPIHYYDTLNDDYRVDTSNGRTTRAGAIANHFQPHNYSTQVEHAPNHMKYAETWFRDDSFDIGSTSVPFSAGLDTMVRQNNSFTYDTADKPPYGVDSYVSVHAFDDQAGPGTLTEEAFDPYPGAYLEQQPYQSYGDDSNQVSRRWLSMIASSPVEGATMAARTRHNIG